MNGTRDKWEKGKCRAHLDYCSRELVKTQWTGHNVRQNIIEDCKREELFKDYGTLDKFLGTYQPGATQLVEEIKQYAMVLFDLQFRREDLKKVGTTMA